MDIDEDRLLTRTEAAALLTSRGFRTAPATLAKYAVTGAGPLMIRFGRKPLYRTSDLLGWAEERALVAKSTSDAGRPLLVVKEAF